MVCGWRFLGTGENRRHELFRPYRRCCQPVGYQLIGEIILTSQLFSLVAHAVVKKSFPGVVVEFR